MCHKLYVYAIQAEVMVFSSVFQANEVVLLLNVYTLEKPNKVCLFYELITNASCAKYY